MAGPTGGLRVNWTSTGRRWARYLRLAGSKPANFDPRLGLIQRQNQPFRSPARTVVGVKTSHFDPRVRRRVGRVLCLPWQAVLRQRCRRGCRPNGFIRTWLASTGSPAVIIRCKRFVRQLRQTQPVPFVRMEVAAGHAKPRWILARARGCMVDGKRKRPHLFRIVLSHSRKGLQ